MKNKIGWCNTTWNPVWGCLNNCEYCYARKIANRFHKHIYKNEVNHQWKNYSDWSWTDKHLWGLITFKPTFLQSQFDKKFPKKPQRIFVGSMSELNYWEWGWLDKVIKKIMCYPQHTFQFLTKFPEVYAQINFPENCWLGITVTSTENYNYYDSGHNSSSIHLAYQKFKISNPKNLKFICFEPLFSKISLNLEGIDWVIIGAETGNRKGKVIPKRKWFEEIVYCHSKIPIYIKDNITKYYPEYKGHKQFP